MTTRTKEPKKLDFPSVHLSMSEHLLLEGEWQSVLDHQTKTGSQGMTDLITEGALMALSPPIESDIEVPAGIDLNTVAIFQAIGLQMRIMGVVSVVEPKDFISKVWKLSRLFYRELLRLSGVKPEGS